MNAWVKKSFFLPKQGQYCFSIFRGFFDLRSFICFFYRKVLISLWTIRMLSYIQSRSQWVISMFICAVLVIGGFLKAADLLFLAVKRWISFCKLSSILFGIWRKMFIYVYLFDILYRDFLLNKRVSVIFLNVKHHYLSRSSKVLALININPRFCCFCSYVTICFLFFNGKLNLFAAELVCASILHCLAI